MKTVIPVAGVGTRLKTHTNFYPRPLTPASRKPMLTFGIDLFIIVVGYLRDKIIYFKNH